jgi:hypothetical protein
MTTKKGNKPVDLERERRIREDIEALGRLMQGDPELSERVGDVLEGRLPLEGNVSEKDWIAVRLPKELVGRADALVERVREKDPAAFAGGLRNRSALVRLALAKGLEALEAQYRKR